MTTRPKPPVDFQASVTIDGSSLTVEYTLRNKGPERLYVFDQPTRFDNGKAVVNRDYMSVLLENERRTVRLLHVFTPAPLLFNIARRPPNYASVLEPGTKLARTVRIMLPLKEDELFYPALAVTTATPLQASAVNVVVGFLEPRGGLIVENSEYDGVVSLRGGWGEPRQWLVNQLVKLTVPVIEHDPPFERFPKLD